MSAVFAVRSLLYCFHICTLVNEVANFFRVGMMPPIPFPFPHGRLGSISTNGTSHLLLGSSLTRRDKCIHCGWGIRPCSPLGLVPNTFPPVGALKFSTNLILVSLLCALKIHAIVGSALPVRRFLIINLIE
jgi:hypothetical protein